MECEADDTHFILLIETGAQTGEKTHLAQAANPGKCMPKEMPGV